MTLAIVHAPSSLSRSGTTAARCCTACESTAPGGWLCFTTRVCRRSIHQVPSCRHCSRSGCPCIIISASFLTQWSLFHWSGQCIDECTAAMMHCRLVEVQSACCSDARNCPDNSPVPRACTVQCALVFPALVNSCAEELNADGVDIDQFRSFAEECMRQDGPALVEYAHDLVRQGCAIDLAAPQDRGRRAQDDQASAQKTGIAKLLQTNENTCSWDSFDDRVVEMSAVCCGSNADEACADGQPPRECSPECAVYFHTFYSNCQTLLSTVLQADFDAYTDFHETCMDEANVELFLIAIKHATCAPLRLLGQCLASSILRTVHIVLQCF
eukprot:SAG31_NODE_1140_length_9701_cov_43.848261_3_plen_327_part_00